MPPPFSPLWTLNMNKYTFFIWNCTLCHTKPAMRCTYFFIKKKRFQVPLTHVSCKKMPMWVFFNKCVIFDSDKEQSPLFLNFKEWEMFIPWFFQLNSGTRGLLMVFSANKIWLSIMYFWLWDRKFRVIWCTDFKWSILKDMRSEAYKNRCYK